MGCAADPTQLLVVVDTNLEAGVEYDSILVSASSAGIGSAEQRFGAGEVELPFSLGVSATSPDRDAPVRVVVSLWTDEGEATSRAVVTRTAMTHFLPGQTRRLDMLLSRACARAGEECGDADDTCVEGMCVSAQVDPATLPHGDPGAPLMSLVDGPRMAPDAGTADSGPVDGGVDGTTCPDGEACTPAPCRTGMCAAGECTETGFEPQGTECDPASGRVCSADGVCGAG